MLELQIVITGIAANAGVSSSATTVGSGMISIIEGSLGIKSGKDGISISTPSRAIPVDLTERKRNWKIVSRSVNMLYRRQHRKFLVSSISIPIIKRVSTIVVVSVSISTSISIAIIVLVS